MRKRSLQSLAVAGVLVLAGALAEPGRAPAAGTETHRAHTRQLALAARVNAYRVETWRWQALMRKPLTRTLAASDPRAGLVLWRRLALRVRRQAQRPPHLRAWLCIHRHEGAWNARTGNGYFGGLQMNAAFQHHFGLDLLRVKGTADRWTPLEQMWVAERAHRSGLGFYPWPTARYCNLI